MSKEILNKDPRPKCRAHDEYTGQLCGESKTRDPQARHTDGGRRPGCARNDSSWGWGRRAASVAPETESPRAAPPDAKKRNRQTLLHLSHTEQHQALRSFKCCAHTQRAHARQHNTKTPTCARCSCLLFQVLLFPSHPPCVTVRGSP